MNNKYVAPELTQYGTVGEITGLTGTATHDDFLTINGGTVASGTLTNGQYGALNCDFKLSGGDYTLTSSGLGDQTVYAANCDAVLGDYRDDGSVNGSIPLP